MSVFLKDPAATLDYRVDWTAIAGDAAIATSDWAVEPADSGGLGIVAEAIGGRRCAVTLTGGRGGIVYRVTNAIMLDDGRRDARVLAVRVEAR